VAVAVLGGGGVGNACASRSGGKQGGWGWATKRVVQC
jgi:hypothetical protein